MAKSLYEYAVSQDDVDTTWGVWGAESILAQTITIGTTGANVRQTVQGIKLLLSKTGGPAGDLTVEIRDTTAGIPTNVRATGTIAMTAIGAGLTWVECSNFIGNTILEASGVYAICIHHLSTVTAGNYIAWGGEGTASSYAGGVCKYSITNGATWADVTDGGGACYDFCFQVFGDTFSATLCTHEDIINKAGSGANEKAIGVSVSSNFAIQAESILNSRTKHNWTDNYSTLNQDVKYILNEIVSDLAAIKVINYSHTGYNSRLESQQMIENLRMDAEKNIKELKEEDIKSFVKNA